MRDAGGRRSPNAKRSSTGDKVEENLHRNDTQQGDRGIGEPSTDSESQRKDRANQSCHPQRSCKEKGQKRRPKPVWQLASL